MTKWHKGPPPSIGWWPASTCRNQESLRWWDGEQWSWPMKATSSAQEAAGWAEIKSEFQEDIEWTDRPADWPERSRT